MASSSDYLSADFKIQQNTSNIRKKSTKIEVRPTKERICNMVLRDEDEETDDEDLTLNSNSPDLLHEETDSALEEDELDNGSKSADDIEDDDVSDAGSMIPDTVIQLADGLLSKLPPRWRNFITRGMSGISLLTGFSLIVWMGPSGLIFLTLLVIYNSFSELIKLGAHRCGVDDKATKRLCWFMFFLSLYFLDGKGVIELLHKNFDSDEKLNQAIGLNNKSSIQIICNVLQVLSRHHVAVVASMYLFSIVWFVATIGNSNYVGRYTLLAWSHMSSFFLAVPAHCSFQILFQGGMIFYIVPMIVITINDICAYYVGFLMGKTPLIKLSPKKTMEGYIGGGVLTVILGLAFTQFCVIYGNPSLICPAESNDSFLSNLLIANENESSYKPLLYTSQCKIPDVFRPQNYQLLFGSGAELIPFVWVHGLFISTFAATLGPFGGFFASGFKRAYKRKVCNFLWI